MFKPVRFFASLITLFLAVLFLISRFDAEVILVYLTSFNFSGLLLAILCIWTSLLISTMRFGIINKNFGIFNSWRFFHKLNMLSTLYAFFAIPLIMQIAGRIQFGTKTARTFYAPITAFEKSVSFGLMLIIAGLSSYTFFETKIFAQDFLYALAIILSVFCFVLLISIAAFFQREEYEKLQSALYYIRKIGLTQNLVLSILLQFFILSSYVVLAVQLLPETSILLLYGAFSIVVLATAIPIGFSGLGVREATAGIVFTYIGLPAEAGIATGLIYGVTHLLILGLNVFYTFSAKDKNIQPYIDSEQIKSSSLWLFTALLTVILMCFQIKVSLLDGMITLNPADLIALIIAINTLLIAYYESRILHFWANQLMWPGIICFACMISIGWFVGWIKFGSNEWAFASRLLGLIPIFSYLIFGACIRKDFLKKNHQIIFKFLIVAFTVTCLTQIFFNSLLPQTIKVYFNWTSFLSGFIGDRNAFAFFGLVLAALSISTTNRTLNLEDDQRLIFLFLGIILAMVTITGSRTGWAGVLIVLTILFFVHRKATLLSIFSYLTTIFLFLVYKDIFLRTSIESLTARGMTSIGTLSTQRILTWETGLNLFLEAPFLGSGLGASIEKIELVIHNLYLWVAGEMGLVGILLCLPITFAIFKEAFSKQINKLSAHYYSFLIFLLAFGAFSLTQDIIYQRIFWFGLGYFMANDKNLTDFRRQT